MKEEINTNNAPKAIGPYSQAVKIGNFLFTSGQIPINPATNEIVKKNFKLQVTQVLKNIEAVVEKSGGKMDNIIKTTVYLTDLNEFPEFNEIYQTFFKPPYPSRATIEVSKLPKGVKIEIDAVAYISK